MNNILPCPFCGSKVELMNLMTPLKMFYCTNYTTCGAIVSFNNQLCNTEETDKNKIACWNRRVKARIKHE